MAVLFSNLLADIAVAVVTCLVLVYLYFNRVFKYWEKRGVRYDNPTLFVGSIGTVFFKKESFGEYMKGLYDKHPGQPVVGLFVSNNPVLMVRSLEVVRSVMVKDAYAFLDRSIQISEEAEPVAARNLLQLKGNKWRHMRMKLTPTFTSGKIKNMFYLIKECGKQLVPCIDQESSKKGGAVVVKDTIARYSTDVIASCAFGLNANSLADPQSEFRAVTRKIFERTATQTFFSFLAGFMPGLTKMLKLKINDESITKYVRKTFWDVVEHRRKNRIVRKDFVDILMRLMSEGEIKPENEKDLQEIKEDSKYMNMEHSKSDEDIKFVDDDFVGQAFIFIAAGFETSSSVISFTLYELALNPDIQDKLRREILEVLDKHNSEVTYEAIAEMSYLDMVVSETLRKYPTLPVLERKCLQNYKIPGTEITIEKGRSVVIPVLGIHWDPTIYPEPEKFDPERFSTENKHKRPNMTHIPFGEGPRMCIGMRFGQIQVKTALVHILTAYKVKPCPNTPTPPLKMKPSENLLIPIEDIILAFEKIK